MAQTQQTTSQPPRGLRPFGVPKRGGPLRHLWGGGGSVVGMLFGAALLSGQRGCRCGPMAELGGGGCGGGPPPAGDPELLEAPKKSFGLN